MQIKPIRSESDYRNALRRIEQLWNALPGSAEEDEFLVLVTLVESYEAVHHPVALPSPTEAIEFRLEQLGQDYRALIGIIGQRTRVYEVMRGDRPLSLNMIRRLNTKLAIPAEVLIQPMKKKPKKAVRTALRRVSKTRKAAS